MTTRDDQKRATIEHVLRCWRRVPNFNFGQFLHSAMRGEDIASLGDRLFLERLEAFVSQHGTAVEIPELKISEIFYFGCSNSDTGHYLFDSGERSADERRVLPPIIQRLDGRFCGSPSLATRQYRHGAAPDWNGSDWAQPQNRGRVVQQDGWTILAFWDRTKDSRFASNGAFLAKGSYDFDVMCEIGKRYFPAIWARLMKAGPMLAAAD